MRFRLLALLTAVALVGAACSQTPETTVVALGDGSAQGESMQEIAEGELEMPAEPVERPSTEPLDQIEPSTTLPPDVDVVDDPPVADEPPVMPGGDGMSWQDRPLAHTVLTGDDLPALGLGEGWGLAEISWQEVDSWNQPSDSTICGSPLPEETSHFISAFENPDTRAQLGLLTLPAVDGAPDALAYLATFELFATCPELESDWGSMDMDVLEIEIAGASESVVISGLVDGNDGSTIAAATVDGHVFVALVERDESQAASSDAALAVSALELSISRL